MMTSKPRVLPGFCYAPSFVTVSLRAAFSGTSLVRAIVQGKRGTEMPSWDKVMSEQGIADVAEYVFQRFISTDSKAQLDKPG